MESSRHLLPISVTSVVKTIRVLRHSTPMLRIKFWLICKTIIEMDHQLIMKVVHEEGNHNRSSREANNQSWTHGPTNSKISSNSNSNKSQTWHWIKWDQMKQQKRDRLRLKNSKEWRWRLVRLCKVKINLRLTHLLLFSHQMLKVLLKRIKIIRRRKCLPRVARSTSKFSLWSEWVSWKVSTKLATKWTSCL